MRAPFQTLTILYKLDKKQILYAVFLRSKERIWQFVSGGGEDNENIYQTAIRELKEETGIHIQKTELTKLDAQTTIPVANVTGEFTWGEDVFVVPEYSFAVNIGNRQIKLSSEHENMQWCNYEEAMSKLEYDSNKTALWELNEKLKRSYT